MKNTNKHIIIIADPIDQQLAGIYYFTINLVKHLIRIDKKNKYTIIKLNKKKIDDTIEHISLKNSIRFLRNDPIRKFHTLPKLIKKLNPDIVIEPAHFGPFNLPSHIKRVTCIHDLTPLLFPKYHPFGSVVAHKLFLKTVITKADLIITNSVHTQTDIHEFSKDSLGKTIVAHLGKRETFKNRKSRDVLDHYKVSEPYFFTLGTIEPRKNLTTLLEAYNIFRRSYKKKVKLVIAGEFGWKSTNFYKRFLKHQFKEDIILLGYANRQDLPYLYSHAEAFIYPSLYEGFGLSVLEAMACGTACIISNTSSLPEVGSGAALYFNPNSPLELKEQMISLFEDKLQKDLQLKAVHQAANFSWEKFTCIITNQLNQL